MTGRPTTWQATAWIWAVRYWFVISLMCGLLPLWVVYINRENGMSSGDQIGFVASLIPALFGMALGYALFSMTKLTRTDQAAAGDSGQVLGTALIIFSVTAAVVSLITMSAQLFLLFLAGLLVPAGMLAGTSAEMAKAATRRCEPRSVPAGEDDDVGALTE